MSGLRFKLCVMMFLQFFIWGAWFELGFNYIPSLGFESWQNAMVFGAFNLGALVALFFSTQFADRKFAAEKFLAFSHLIGGLAIAGLFFLPGKYGTQPGEYLIGVTVTPQQSTDSGIGMGKLDDNTPITVEGIAKDAWPKTEGDETPKLTVTARVTGGGTGNPGETKTAVKEPVAPFWPFFALMLVHSLFYVPTISITNSIAFANLRNPSQDFGPVRMWGTIGWIAASWPFIFILVDWATVAKLETTGTIDTIGKALGTPLGGAALRVGQSYIFLVAGLASLVLALFSLALPHTPPKPAVSGSDSLAWLKAMRLLRHPFVLVLFVVTFIDAAVHQSFFYWTASFLGPQSEGGAVGIPSNWVTAVMKIGQIAEILTMLILGYVLKNLGWRTTMVFGVLGHAARFAVFAYYPDQTAAIVVNVLHGICYAFFFATVYIFVDEYFPKDVRSSAQGLFNVLILGVGPFVANVICGELKTAYAMKQTVDGKVVDTVNYGIVFQYSMWAAIAGAVLLFLLFHPKKTNENDVRG